MEKYHPENNTNTERNRTCTKILISIGYACQIRRVIENHYYKESIETNFFDWLMTSMRSVIELLDRLPNYRFSTDNMLIEFDELATPETIRVRFTDFNDLISIHDLHKEIQIFEELLMVAERYNRRAERLYNKIKDNDEIIFVRFSTPSVDEQMDFFSTLDRINSSNNFKLIIFDLKDSVDISSNLINKIIYINIEKYRLPGIKHETWYPEYDWSKIFSVASNDQVWSL
jgi:hypothetical protein